MTTDTLTPPAESPVTSAPVTSAAPAGNTYSVLGLVLSILAIPLGMAPLAIAGVVLGFVGRKQEPAAITTANWAIVVGLVALFGWILLGIIGAALVAPFVFPAIALGVF